MPGEIKVRVASVVPPELTIGYATGVMLTAGPFAEAVLTFYQDITAFPEAHVLTVDETVVIKEEPSPAPTVERRVVARIVLPEALVPGLVDVLTRHVKSVNEIKSRSLDQ